MAKGSDLCFSIVPHPAGSRTARAGSDVQTILRPLKEVQWIETHHISYELLRFPMQSPEFMFIRILILKTFASKRYCALVT